MSFTERSEANFSGFKELEDKLAKMNTKVASKELVKSLRFGIRPMVKAAKLFALLPKRSGALSASIGTWSRKGKRGNHVASVFFGPKRGSKKAVALYEAYYGKRKVGKVEKRRDGIRHGHLVEFGTKTTRAQPFMMPAYDGNKVRAVVRFRDALRDNILKVARK